MSDYIMDMRQVLNRFAEYDETHEEILGILSEQDINVKKFRYESDHYVNVYLEDLKVGDRIYIYDCVDGYLTSTHYWVEIEITHIYGGVYFYKIIDAPTEDEKWKGERHFVEGSMLALQNIFPKKVVITKDYEFTCVCPRVEFIYDEDMNNTYSSVYNITEARRY